MKDKSKEDFEVRVDKLIHCSEQEMINNIDIFVQAPYQPKFKSIGAIIQQRYSQALKDVDELAKQYEVNSPEYNDLVKPLKDALGQLDLQTGRFAHEDHLNALRAYKQALTMDRVDKPCITQQLLESKDPLVLKVLKGIALSVLTLGGYAVYAVAQAVTGKPLAGIDNAGESLAKRADSEILKPPRYQSMQHISALTQAASTSRLEQGTSPKHPEPPSFKPPS